MTGDQAAQVIVATALAPALAQAFGFVPLPLLAQLSGQVCADAERWFALHDQSYRAHHPDQVEDHR